MDPKQSEIPSFPGRRSKWLKLIFPLLGAVVFVLGLCAITHLLREHSMSDVISYLKTIPLSMRISAVVLTVCSYLLLSRYDLLAFRYMGAGRLSQAKIIFVAMIAFAFGNNIGVANLAGSSLRFRLYSALGIEPRKILKVVLFASLTFWTGACAMGGFLFVFRPLTLPASVPISQGAMQAFGVALLCAAVAYIVLAASRQSVTIRGYKLSLPPLPIACEQIIIAASDWVLAAFVLYILLPESVETGFMLFLTIFVSAQMLALITHVPGGVGLLEALVVYFVSPLPSQRAPVLGGLIAYRMIYYLMPLVAASIGLVYFELSHRRRRINDAQNP